MLTKLVLVSSSARAIGPSGQRGIDVGAGAGADLAKTVEHHPLAIIGVH